MGLPARKMIELPGDRRPWDPADPFPAVEGVDRARVCAVPGCRERPAGRLPLCDAHRICPKCGSRIHVGNRVSLYCCSLHVPLVRRMAWLIPWRQTLGEARLLTDWPHRMRRARIVVGHTTVAKRLPWPEETE